MIDEKRHSSDKIPSASGTPRPLSPTQMNTLSPEDAALLLALSALPETGFSRVGLHATLQVRPARAATLSGLSEVVVGDDRDAPRVRQRELERLEAHVERLCEQRLLEHAGERWKLLPGLRRFVGSSEQQDEAAAHFVRGMLDWLETHHLDFDAVHREQETWLQALAHAERLILNDEFVYLVGWLAGTGGYLHRRGEIPTRARLLERAVEWMTAREHALGAWIHYQAAAFHHSQHNLERAAALYEESSRLAERAGATKEVGMALGELAAVRILQHRFDDAIGLFHEKLTVMQRAQSPEEFAATCGDLAELLAVKGRFADARELLEQKLGLEQALNRPDRARITRLTLGDLLAEEGRLAEAIPLVLTVLPELQAADPPNFAVALANLGSYQWKAGEYVAAQQSLEAAIVAFCAQGRTRNASEVRTMLDELREGRR